MDVNICWGRYVLNMDECIVVGLLCRFIGRKWVALYD